MVSDEQRIHGVMRGSPPCKDCKERHTACHDNCPKDMRGEYGYKHWKSESQEINEKRRTYVEENYKAYKEQKRRNVWERTHS